MRTLHLYLLRQTLVTVLMTVMVFTFVLLLGNVLREILSLLLNQQVTAALVLKAVGLLIPFVLVFALPMGMLTATLLVFGRFSADQELTATRASGISLVALITPLLVLAVLFSGLCAYINMELAPRCRAAYKNMLFEIGVSGSLALIPEKQFVRDLPGGYTIYIDKKEGENLRDVFIHQSDDDANVTRWFRAPSGKLVYNETNKIMTLTLYGANGAIQEQDNITPVMGEEMSIELNPKPQKERRQKPKISDMSFTQLREEIADMEQLKEQAQPISANSPEQLRQQAELIKLWRRDLSMPAKVQLHRMVSFSFACIGFTLIGIPLGIRAHRRETSAGIALALILVLVYYSFIIVGQSLDTHSEFAPHLIVWVPNFLFQAIGAVLLWRANRGI